MVETNQSSDKVWERPWNNDELKTHSTNWTLAGDAGLLLALKQFSENILSKTITIEKELQKLAYEEEQCHVKFSNAASNFLMLENTQFIENRVYEHENVLEQSGTQSSEKQEKTKAEKENELFIKINDAVNIGMSIMDTYFDKIDPKQLNKNNYSDSEDESIEDSNEKDLDNEDLVIYETKDPYVLRSLPYLIGSQSYLENDHVGLKDLDSDDEESEEDASEQSKSKEMESDETDIDDDMDDNTPPSKPTIPKAVPQAQNYDDDNDDEDDDIFKTNYTKKNENLFDDDDDESEEDEDIFDDKKSEVKIPEQVNREIEDEDDREEAEQPQEKLPSGPTDFLSELNNRLARKQQKKDPESVAVQQPKTEPEIKQTKKKETLLESESDNELFSNKSSSQAAKKSKGLFDDSDTEEAPVKTTKKLPEIPKKSEQEEKPKPKLPVKSLFDDDDDQADLFTKAPAAKVTEPKSEQKLPDPKIAAKKKMSLFDDEDEDDADSLFVIKKNPQVKPSVPDSKAVQPPAPSITTKPAPKKVTLFDDDDDEDEDFDIKKPAIKETQPELPKPKIESSTKKSSLFDTFSDDDKDDLFSFSNKETTVSKKEELKVEEPFKKEEDDELIKPKPPIKNQVFDPLGLKSNSLFQRLAQTNQNDSDEDGFGSDESPQEPKKPVIVEPEKKIENPPVLLPKIDDLFKSDESLDNKLNIETKPKESSLKKQENIPASKPKEKASIFDSDEDDDDDLFSVKNKKEVKKEEKKELPPLIESKKSILSSDNDDEDDLFNIKKKDASNDKPNILESKIPTIKKEEEKSVPKKSLFDSSNSNEDDLFKAGKKNKEPEKSLPTIEATKETVPIESEGKEEVLIKPKPISKNLLFDPLGLKSNKLFKKLADTNKISDDENEPVKEEEKPDPKPLSSLPDLGENEDDLFSFNSKPPKKIELVKDDPFDTKVNEKSPLSSDELPNLKTNLIQSTANSAQKDRIKAAGRKRAPPTQRKVLTDENSDLFSVPIMAPAAVPETVTVPVITKVTEEPPAPVENEPLLVEKQVQQEQPKMEEVKTKEPEQPSKKKIDPFGLDDPDDIFSDISVDNPVKRADFKPKTEPSPKKEPLKKSNDPLKLTDDSFNIFSDPEPVVKEKEKPKEIKPIETKPSKILVEDNDDDLFGFGSKKEVPKQETSQKSKPASSTIFDNLLNDDVDDLFKPKSSVKKPAEKSKLDDLFADEDIFSDDLLKPKKTALESNKSTLKADIFSDLNTDEDIFAGSLSKSSTSSTTKKVNKPDPVFDDPLNFFEK